MRTIAKPILFIVTILLGILLLLTLGLNLYLRSSGVRELLVENLSRSVGRKVAVGGIDVLPSGEIAFRKILVGTPGQPPSFTAETASIRPGFSELLHGRIVMSGLTLVHPVLFLNASRPLIPETTDHSGSGVSMAVGQQTLSDTVRPPGDATGASGFSGPPSTPRHAVTVDLKRIRITGGECTLCDERNLPLLSLKGLGLGLDLKAATDGQRAWLGDLRADELTLGRGLVIHQLRSDAVLTGDLKGLSLDRLTAVLGGGKLTGSAHLDLPPSSPAYKATLVLSGASLKQLLADASLGNSAAEGSVSGNMDLGGIAGIPSSSEGKGLLNCTGAVIQPVDFLRQIGQILQIDELQLLRLAEANCAFRIVSGNIVVEDLLLRSENLILTAKGPVLPSGDLDLQARLLFNEKLTGRLRGLLGQKLTVAPEPGYSQVPFHVTGTATNPKTDLVERLTGIRIGGDLGGILQGLFGRPSPPKTDQTTPAAQLPTTPR